MEIFFGVLVILIAHFVADFIFQSHYLAINKSSSVWALIQHIIIYALSFYIIFGLSWYPLYYILNINITAQTWLQLTIGITVVNSLLHYFTDFFTSKLTRYFWNKKDYHNFFVIIGFDQLLHTGLLIYSYIEMLQNFNYV